MNDMRECWKRNADGLERLASLGHVPSGYLALRRALYRAQTAVCDALSGDCFHGAPVAAGMLPYNPTAMAGILDEIAGSMSEGTAAADLDRMRAVPDELPLLADIAMFSPDSNRLNEWAARRSVSGEAALFFGRACGAPYVFRAVQEATTKTLETDAPREGKCPSCGSPPGLALICGDDGHRELACSLCGSRRGYPRLQCPFCGKAGILETVRDADAAARWIEGCESCGGYLKTVDARSAPVLPLVESVETLYLDLIAEKEGFRRGMPYVALN